MSDEDPVLREVRNLRGSLNKRFDTIEGDLSHVRKSLFEGHEGRPGIVTRLALNEHSVASHRKRIEGIERRVDAEPTMVNHAPPSLDSNSLERAKPYAVGTGVVGILSGIIYGLVELFKVLKGG